MSADRTSFFLPEGLVIENVLALLALGWGIISTIAWG
jgi:hypothetical protein